MWDYLQTISVLTKQMQNCYYILRSGKTTEGICMGYKSPFIKPFLNKTKKFTKENKIQKNKLFNIFKKKKRWRGEKNERDTIPTCWTIKGSFHVFF